MMRDRRVQRKTMRQWRKSRTEEEREDICTQTDKNNVMCHWSTPFDWASNINKLFGSIPTFLFITSPLNVPVTLQLTSYPPLVICMGKGKPMGFVQVIVTGSHI